MKTYISDSLISETLLLMREIKENGCKTIEQISRMKTFYGINKTAALNMANQLTWIEIDREGAYKATDVGEKVLGQFDGVQVRPKLYRDILKRYIDSCHPVWARRIPFGRTEAYRIMSDEEQVCFKKAGLMNSPVTRETVEWWDSLAAKERRALDQIKEEMGRKGEELTIDYEIKRTGESPTWEAIDSNLAGYDVMSIASQDDRHHILIEVKSSSQDIHSASFYITQKEWKVASAGINQNRYYFYLWSIRDSVQVAIVPYLVMKRHIPSNNGDGEWNEVEVPFDSFSEGFQLYMP